MECRVCPKCGRRVYSCKKDKTWECPYPGCDMPVTADCIVEMECCENGGRRE